MRLLETFFLVQLLLLLAPMACTKLPKAPSIDPNSRTTPSPNPDPRKTVFPKDLSLASFKTNVYTPILANYCSQANCHANTFADVNLKAAHEAFLKRVGFDHFTQSEQTPVLTKLKAVHNCWQPDNKMCVNLMIESIDRWVLDLKNAGYDPAAESYPIKTQAVAFSSGKKTALPIDSSIYLGASVQTAALAEPFVKLNDDADGSIQSYAMGRADAPAVDDEMSNLDPTKALTFTFDVPNRGFYQLWARVKTPSEKKNGFFVSLKDDRISPFNTPVTGPTVWKWVQFNDQGSKDFFVDDGPLQLPIIFRAPEAKIDYVVLYQKEEGFDGGLFSDQHYDIAIDLPIPNSRIIATVWEYSTANDKKSIGVRELRIESPKPLHIKGIYPLINGIFYPSHSTYTLVDAVFGGSADRSAQVIKTGGSTSTTWIADFSKDSLSFGFDVLEEAPIISQPTDPIETDPKQKPQGPKIKPPVFK